MEELLAKPGRWVVSILSAANVLRGERQVLAFPDLRPNRPVVKAGEVLASTTIEGDLTALEPVSRRLNLLLAAAYLVTRRLWMAIGYHMLWNYVQSAVFSGIVSGGVSLPGLFQAKIEGPSFFTGGTFGMEQSVFALVLCTLTGVVMLVIAMRRGHMVPAPWNRKR